MRSVNAWYSIFQMNTMNNKGYNTLHTAALHQYPFILSMLASHKYGVKGNLYWDSNYLDRVTEDGANQTALHLACFNQDSESVQVLLRYGANTEVSSNRTDTALQIACRKKDKVIVQMLVKNGAEIPLMFPEMIFLCKCDIAISNLQFNHAMSHTDAFGSRLVLYLLKSIKDCPCGSDTQFQELSHPVRIAYGLLRKCKKCLEDDFVKDGASWLQSTIGYKYYGHFPYPTCAPSEIFRFDVVRFMCDTNADMSEYVLNTLYHQTILEKYPRCSIRLLIRSYGMKDILADQYRELVNHYWKIMDYETFGLLYLSEYTINPYKCIQLDTPIQQNTTQRTNDLILVKCITESTWIEKDMEGMTNLERLQYAAKQPRTLQNCCVITIRKSISSNVIYKAEKIPIPAYLKRAVVLDQIRTAPCCHSQMTRTKYCYTLY